MQQAGYFRMLWARKAKNIPWKPGVYMSNHFVSEWNARQENHWVSAPEVQYSAVIRIRGPEKLIILSQSAIRTLSSAIIRIRGPEKKNNLTVEIERARVWCSACRRVRGNVKVFDKQKYDPNAGNSSKHEPVNFWIGEIKK